MTALRAGAATDVGKVRSNNQDQFLLAPPLYAVADGMGGHAAGEVASRVAVEAFRAAFEAAAQASAPQRGHAPDREASPGAEPDGSGSTEAAVDEEEATPVPLGPGADVLVSAALQANRAVWERGQQEPSFRGMGTTLVGLGLVYENEQEVVGLVNVGDSRIYLLRNDELEQVTTDHTLVQELVEDGQLTEAEAGVHPQRHVLTRALGVDHDVDVDLIEVIPYRGDRFLLCSDGLPREVSDNQIASILRRLADPDEAAKELVSEARAHGGNDNITVVIVDVVDDDDRAGRASAALAGERTSTSRPDVVCEPDERTEDEGATTARASTATARARKEELPSDRRPYLTPRVVLFGVLVLLLLAGGAAAVVYYARGSYYVGVQGDRLTIYRGRPGGVLWFDPTVEQKTGVTTSQVLPSRVPDLRSGREEPTLADARQYVRNLQAEGLAHGVGAPPAPSDTTAGASTTTAVPASPASTTATPPTAPTGVSP